MKFSVHGPYVIPRKGLKKNIVDDASLPLFWEDIDYDEEGISGGIGCYIFAVKAAKGIVPWYVGKTNKQRFSKECFTDRNIKIINHIIDENFGTPIVMLIAQRTANNGTLKKPSATEIKEITELEKLLISFALHKNPEIKNYQHTRLFRNLVVPGIINTPPGGQSNSVKALRKILSL